MGINDRCALSLDWLLAGSAEASAIEGEGGARVGYGELRRLVADMASALPRDVDALGVACASPVGYALGTLAALATGLPVLLMAPDERSPAPAAGAMGVVVGAEVDGAVDVVRVGGARGARDPLLDATALAIATSGSTGAPRWVALGAAGVRANIEAIVDYLPIARRRVAITLPLWHAYAMVGQLLAGLRAGATSILLGPGREPARLWHALATRRVDGLSSVAAQLAALARVADGAWRPQFLASAGGPLPRDLAARLGRLFPGARLFDQYGLTEASPRVCAVSSAEPAFAAGSVGRPLPGVRVWAEREGRPCVAGQAGELWVGGPSLTLGYLGAPDATRERLRGGALRTGDRGHVDADGFVFVLGREDDLVNIGGERISQAAVARVLGAAPGVTDAFVHAVEDGDGGAVLVAVLEAPAGADRVVDRARALARASLRPAQRPVRYVVVPALPRLASHKPDRRALRALATDAARAGGELRELVAAHAALGDDDEAPLALDSLAMVMLIDDLELVHDVEITAADIAAGRLGSVAAIAALLAARGRAGDGR